MNRRNFLRGSGIAAAACALGGVPERASANLRPTIQSPGSFTFAFFTDVHIEPEMDAPEGTALAMDIINSSDAEFAICGGDHVYDALKVHKDRIVEQYELYAEAERTLRMPVWHVVIFGKAMFQKVFGTPTYYAFTHKGVNFIVLDSILIKGRDWFPGIDIDQAAWLERVLQATVAMPSIVVSHVPWATSMATYGTGSNSKVYEPIVNSDYMIPMIEKYNVIALLQGHTHIVENVRRHGIEYVTGGAVCGNWWRGMQYGDHEGVTFVTVDNGSVSTHYVPTGFLSVDQ